jgi:hypothetical protein
VTEPGTGTALASFAFVHGELRGTQLSLHPSCLVHRGHSYLETLPLAGMTAVRVTFERNARRLGWGIALVVAALLMLAVAGPLGAFASGAAAAGQQTVPVMQVIYRLMEALASALPVAALASVIGGSVLCAFGWMGSTLLLVSLPGAERAYRVRGRDTRLLDFAEALSERLMLARR